MPKRGIDYCLDVIQYLREKGIKDIVSAHDLKMAVIVKAGSLQVTRNRYFDLLQEFGLIEPVGDGTFKVNYDRADELML